MAWWRSGVRFPSAPHSSAQNTLYDNAKCALVARLRAAGAYQVGAVDGGVADVGAGVGGLDHLAAADVDADVVDRVAEEDEVAGLERGDGDVRDGGVLPGGRV